jgi:hypothetical protein
LPVKLFVRLILLWLVPEVCREKLLWQLVQLLSLVVDEMGACVYAQPGPPVLVFTIRAALQINKKPVTRGIILTISKLTKTFHKGFNTAQIGSHFYSFINLTAAVCPAFV